MASSNRVVLQGTAYHFWELPLLPFQMYSQTQVPAGPKGMVQIMTCDQVQYSPRELHDLLIYLDRNLESV